MYGGVNRYILLILTPLKTNIGLASATGAPGSKPGLGRDNRDGKPANKFGGKPNAGGGAGRRKEGKK